MGDAAAAGGHGGCHFERHSVTIGIPPPWSSSGDQASFSPPRLPVQATLVTWAEADDDRVVVPDSPPRVLGDPARLLATVETGLLSLLVRRSVWLDE